MFITYLVLRILTYPFAFLSYPMIHSLGKYLGTIAYYAIPKYRKRALSNLALSDLELTNAQIRYIARASLQSLMITCLEYPKLNREKDISKIATCENPEEANEIMAKGKGVIFFCGHQANWELLFLEGTSRMPGVAIGRPVKNAYLYRWVKTIREKFGGKIVAPRDALKEGLKGLRSGAFLGIVGDQGMPDSGFSSRFLGRKAYTSPAPAMLAYKTNTPMIVATTKREKGKYNIHYSPAIYPNPKANREQEIRRLMEEALQLYEESIRQKPEQWLWIHNRWKQQVPGRLKRIFRQDSVAIFLPEDTSLLEELGSIRSLYPSEQITLFLPRSLGQNIPFSAHISPYADLRETLQDHYRFKVVFNFTGNPLIDKYYKKKGAQAILRLKSYAELEKRVKNA